MAKNKKLVLWCGNAPNHKALANKLHQHIGLSQIIIDKKTKFKNPFVSKKNIIQRVFEKLIFYEINNSWVQLQKYYQNKFSDWPLGVEIVEVDNINSEKAYEATIQIHPDLIMVSGTQLVKEKMLSIPATIGIINLHTGLSPYVKGGPNCTNWCISNNDWHLIGNTIMWINAGIDTGNLITTETIDVRASKNLFDAHLKVMEHAHDLYLRAIEYLFNHPKPYISIAQDEVSKGKVFLTKMWNKEQKKKLLKNWAKRDKVVFHSVPRTISLPK